MRKRFSGVLWWLGFTSLTEVVSVSDLKDEGLEPESSDDCYEGDVVEIECDEEKFPEEFKKITTPDLGLL